MAVVQITRAPGRDAYEAVNAALREDGGPARPDGLTIHTASETESGEVLIVDVWESAEAREVFADRITKVFESLGLGDMMASAPPPELYEPFDVQ